MPKEKPPREPPLLDDVKKTKSGKLRNSVEKVDALTSEEEADLERGGVFALRGTKRQIVRNCMWAGYYAGALLLFGLCIALLVVLGFHVHEVIQTGTTGDVIAGMLDFLFGVVTTLAVEILWWRSRPKD